ncbi:MAG: MFS transporter [Bacteroidetes bacterium]|uniref:MFS transporter n=1 Tax=Candidatus Cryptobacteroides merdavium TaxID=2840769 RepID=A0A9D9HDD5_9BACT|nr:MFS transporter [Candidatus Cryptobacteroides merdavium]
MSAKSSSVKVLPVLFGFFVMGFCDVVGIATSYVKQDFKLSETVAGFIPSMVFIWFLLISVPSAMWMNKVGRKTMVQLSNAVTFVGMLIPFVHYGFATCMAAFVLLGVGNTMLQVSLNPLLTNVVSGARLTSMLTAGQVIKAVSSFCGPFIAAFAVSVFGEWRYLFPIFAAVTLLSMIWLMFTDVKRETVSSETSSSGAVFSLLKDRTVLLLFLGIFFVVGVDVGTNTLAPKLLMEREGLAVDQAGLGSSLYFVCRTAGALIGSVLLAKVSDVTYFRANILVAMAAIVALAFAGNTAMIMVIIGCIGFFCSSIFSVIYSQAMKSRPDKANEISGLMIMGVSGGAVIPPVMGLLTDLIGNQTGSVIVIAVCIAYLTFCSFWLKKA